MCQILLIEDDPDDVFLFRKAMRLSSCGSGREIAIEHVKDGLEAVLRIAKLDLMDKLPDILVLDLNMPRLDGISFLCSLRQSLSLKTIPVFVMTTSSESSRHLEAMRAGASKVYVKPDDIDDLVAITNEIVAASARFAAPAQRPGGRA